MFSIMTAIAIKSIDRTLEMSDAPQMRETMLFQTVHVNAISISQMVQSSDWPK